MPLASWANCQTALSSRTGGPMRADFTSTWWQPSPRRSHPRG